MKKPNEIVFDVIACGVLAVDLKHIANETGLDARLHFLPGGLHDTPDRLRVELQKKIDEIDASGLTDRVVIGYGVCGRGTVGLHARRAPLVIPRVHDCIALFLGSDNSYYEQFTKHPGTYYLSAGWVEEKVDGSPRRNMGSDSTVHPLYSTYEQLVEAYGSENADYIRHFMESWTRNYTRSVFIDTGVGDKKERYASQASEMARKFKWEYARLTGTHALLTETLITRESSDEILVVPPGGVTHYDALRRRLDATRPATPAIEETLSMEPPPVDNVVATRHGIGLGIDAGGTYTDAVLYDFDRNEVLAKSKALTTHWDYCIGIQEALGKLDAERLRLASLVAVSTTIATNAIVEDRGQTVGLLVMPPCGWKEVDGFRHTPLAIIHGQLEIDGTEIEPVDVEQVKTIAQSLIRQSGVTAFAVGGYAAHANPAHELLVKSIVTKTTGMSVTCSHELSSSLHYRVRAETAALNARIIPCLEALLTRITNALTAAGINAPVMVVRSDGSFMSLAAALERPLETMLSGPAASAAGAGWLAQTSDALVADIGGTTTDTATLRGGRVRLNQEGAWIGGWQTHILALDLQTIGLGGDSHVHFRDNRILIGPERVAPVSWLATTHPGTVMAINWIEERITAGNLSSNDMVFLARTGKTGDADLEGMEQDILSLLTSRPYSLHELTTVLQKPHSSMVPLKRLIARHLIQRCSFTPTDALHAAGKISLWDYATAMRIAELYARRFQQSTAQWIQSILTMFERTLAGEILKKQISGDVPVENLDQQPLAGALISRILDRTDQNGYTLNISIQHPVIGIGAPAFYFIPDACARLNAKAIIPPHADVANAVGAIIGTISVHHQVRITTSDSGFLRLNGIPEAPTFKTIEQATAHATEFLKTHLEKLARLAGCNNPAITISPSDSIAPTTNGTAIFISRTMEGYATGAPDY